VKFAAATVPVVAGSVTPPVKVRVLAGANTTVPPDVGDTAMLPKFMLVTRAIVIGVMMFADALAVAVACAKEEVDDAPTMIAAATSTLEMMFFILFSFLSLSYLFEFVCFVACLPVRQV
jgi:hypothetical protein